MKKIFLALILLCCITKSNSQDKTVTLVPGNTYVQKLHKGEKHKYIIKLHKGDFCTMVVIQKGVDVVVDLSDPLFKKIQSVDTPNENDGPEDIEFTSEADGSYYLDISPLDYQDFTEPERTRMIEQNQGDYEINSISVLSKEEHDLILTEKKLKKEKLINSLNLGFERTAPDKKMPAGWRKWDTLGTFVIDKLEKREGKKSLLIESDKKSNSYSGAIFDSIIPVFAGQTIELRGSMKLKDVANGYAGLFMILYGDHHVILESDDMHDRNIQGTNDWTQYSVIFPLTEDVRKICFGAMLTGSGKLWVDDLQILIDEKDISEVEFTDQKRYKADEDVEFDNGSKISSVDLTETSISNLDMLGKVWGFLKYYHPAIARGEYNWDYELLRIMPGIISARDKSERNGQLSEWIKRLERTYPAISGEKAVKEVKINPDMSWMNDSELGKELTSRLINIRNATKSGSNYYIGKIPGVGNPEFRNENPYYSMKYPDVGFRLLALFRYWNIIQYFFPDKHLIGENWDDIMKEYIPQFVNASDEIQYKLAATSLISRIHDTHANVWEDNDPVLKKYYGIYRSPVKVRFIENKAVVIGYYNQALGEQSGLKRGDIIQSVNNILVDEILKDKLPITAASNYPTQLRNIANNLLRSGDSTLDISYERENSVTSTQIQCFTWDKIGYAIKDTCFKLINPEISYIYPGTIKNKYLPEIMEEVMKTKGLIIDLRCYPSEFIVFSLGDYLHPDPVPFVKFSVGSVNTPGLFTVTDNLEVGKKNENYYKGKIVIIVDQETQSQAEYTTLALRTAPNAVVIGSTTAGADGNVSYIKLPGNVQTMISGIGVLYPDGRETQRVGIVPDIEVKPTIKGISEGRDELLEKAVEIINGE